jgi:hypothetical protein
VHIDNGLIGIGLLISPSMPLVFLLFTTPTNNIPTLKLTIKSNTEHNVIFYIRHFFSLDEIKINISYIILRHMCTAFTSKNYSLPYSSFIHWIIKGCEINMPDSIVEKLRVPTNLFDELINLG